jgi:methionyl-tRNA synthetase
LPYANGPIHIGHLVEYLQTDIWVRFQKLIGNNCIYVCASDAHGTPIMLRARDEDIDPEQLVERYRKEHSGDFAEFHIEFDNYHSTHSEENRALVEDIYSKLQDKNLIAARTIEQAYDEEAKMFLPDRFVRGTCPSCKAEDQYGDSCEQCGSTYNTTDLIDAKSILSGATPIQKESEHFFFKLAEFEDMLRDWTGSGVIDTGVANKLGEWFETGLRDWDISRDAPYFGFRIPGTEDKYFYVWLDAPVGYLASFKNLCERRDDLSFEDYFGSASDTELYHFIGKDIVYFHTLFWPAVLEAAEIRKPSGVFIHGFLTVNGQKMSKSRGTFISARTFLDHLDPETLRYYYASKLGSNVDDIDLNLEDFVARTNTDLVNKLVNIASRCAGFISKGHSGQLADSIENAELYDSFVAAGDNIAALYEQRQFSKAVREIMSLADQANRYIDERKPWVLAKEDGKQADVQSVCTEGLNLFRILMIYLKPILPVMSGNAEAFLNTAPWSWDDRRTPLLGTSINPYRALMTRIDSKAVDKMVETSKENAPIAKTPAKEDAGQHITIDDFLKVDLRVVDIVAASHVDGADSLIQVTVSLGDDTRNVLAGIKSAYDPASLVGKQAILVANLKPRKMKFGVSEGMLLAAGPGGEDIYLVSPDDGAKAGMQVK